jgi:tRNA-specific 2-thiouridylase
MNWISPDLLPATDIMEKGIAVFAKLRNTAPASSARLFMMEGQRVRLELEAPEYGIARGQAGVIYDAGDDSLMLGGGWIADAPTNAEIAQTEIAVSA